MDINQLVKMKEIYQAEVKKKGEEVVKAYLTDWFEAHPDVYAISWTQYTPYFNDGDECVFRVGDAEGFSTKEIFEEENAHGYREGDVEWKVLQSLNKDFDKIEDVFKSVFGDHAQVTATREGIDVEEYQHD